VLHVVDGQDRWFSGGEATLQIADRIAILRPLAFVGRLPVVNRAVEPGYRLIANNRHRISRLLRLEGRTINE
jgi:predicted DCC family thiol-disulfide oxidoreductase YuxK